MNKIGKQYQKVELIKLQSNITDCPFCFSCSSSSWAHVSPSPFVLSLPGEGHPPGHPEVCTADADDDEGYLHHRQSTPSKKGDPRGAFLGWSQGVFPASQQGVTSSGRRGLPDF